MPKQHRDAGGDERAERDHENQQRDRQRGELGLAEVVLQARVDRLIGARLAHLPDEQPGVGLHRGGRGQRGPDPILGGVGIPGDLQRDQRGGSVARDLALVAALQRRLDLGHRRDARETSHEALDGSSVLLRPQAARPALDQHLLGRAHARKLPGQHPIGRPRLAHALILGLERDHAHRATDRIGDEHTRQPPQHRGAPVPGAPSGSASGERRWRPDVGRRHGPHLSFGRGCVPVSPRLLSVAGLEPSLPSGACADIGRTGRSRT
jgi:hypothetical protein